MSTDAKSCPKCQSLVFDHDAMCEKCLEPKPGDGWIAIPSWKDQWLGRILDNRYRIVQRLGSGVTSTVYRIVLEHLKREFAAKILTDKKVIDSPRWQREARVLGKLRNPHVVRIVEVIEERHSVILITEYVEGITIEEIVEGSPDGIPVHRALELVRQIANGIHEAHTRDIIHRDLKPANIIVQTLPAIGDFAKILDFGLAKNQAESSSETQGFVGTPDFASPEQIANEKLNARSDIYSLGGLLFYMLTGQPPFKEKSVMRVLQAHLWGEVPNLSDIRSEFENMTEVNNLIHLMMAKSSHDRPESAAEVCELIANVGLEGGSLSTESTSALGTPSEIIETPSMVSVTSVGDIVSAKRNSVRIFSTALNKEHVSEIQVPDGEVSALFGLADTIIFGTSNGRVMCMDREKQTFKTHFEDPRRSPINAIAANSHSVIIAASDSGRLYAALDGNDFRRIPNKLDVRCVAVALEAPLICAASDSEIVVYAVNDIGKWKETNRWRIADPRDVAISPDGDIVATLDFKGLSTLYDRKTGRLIQEFLCAKGVPVGIAFTMQSELIAVETNGENLTLMNVSFEAVSL